MEEESGASHRVNQPLKPSLALPLENTPVAAVAIESTPAGNEMNEMNENLSVVARDDGSLDNIVDMMKGSPVVKASDYANYFCSYSYLYHQKQMLSDGVRMDSYYRAIMDNDAVFKGKIVLDVGTGSGILAVWAALAGAEKVYAVEYTDIATHARRLVACNNVSDRVEVVQCAIEDFECPEKVDIIVSEWMGYMLLRESMLDSLIYARDHFLRENGLMFPSRATIMLAVISNEEDRLRKQTEFLTTMQDWFGFVTQCRSSYGIDMTCLSNSYEAEQKQYYLFSSLWSELEMNHVVSDPIVVKSYNLYTCTVEDVRGVESTQFQFKLTESVRVSGFAGWFTADFLGNDTTPLNYPVTLSTAPEIGYTHWGQQVFYLEKPLDVVPGDVINGAISMRRQKKNIRMYEVELAYEVIAGPGIYPGGTTTVVYQIP